MLCTAYNQPPTATPDAQPGRKISISEYCGNKISSYGFKILQKCFMFRSFCAEFGAPKQFITSTPCIVFIPVLAMVGDLIDFLGKL